MWEIGPVVVAACGISPGQRVLDVAAGTGNVAIRAAQAGAEVVASDITPENLEAGRREAETLGVALEWVEADAQALPFGDGEFDVVTSSFGPVVSVYEALRDEPDRAARLHREFLDFAHQANRGAPDGSADYPYEYVLVIARKRSDG
jgi:SAM-dependent methyltransferase